MMVIWIYVSESGPWKTLEDLPVFVEDWVVRQFMSETISVGGN